jgi:uncharacterized membrane protein YesL
MFKGPFDPENKFWSFMNKITDLFFLAILWFLFSIPLVTIGASTVALFHFTLRQVDDTEGYAFRSFLQAFKKNFWQATALWFLFLVCLVFFIADYHALFSYRFPSVIQVGLFSLVTALALLSLILFCYVFPLISCFHVSVRKALGDALVMGVSNIGYTTVILSVYCLSLWVSSRFPYLSIFFMALALFLDSYLYKKVFSRYLA